MKLVKSLLMGTGAVVLAGLILTLALPKAAHAIVATAVNVVNTTANPVPNLDTEKLARIPYESTAIGSNCPAPGQVGACFFSFSPVPGGYRLVVENLSGYFQISPAATAAVEGYIENNAFRIKSSFAAPLGQIDLGGHIQAAFSNATRFYVDSGEGVFAVASANWSNGSTSMVLTGYLENCTITGCPAVQH
jgi:hypothetical protein